MSIAKDCRRRLTAACVATRCEVDEALREVGNAGPGGLKDEAGGVATRCTFGGERSKLGRGLTFRRRIANLHHAQIPAASKACLRYP